MTAYPMFTVLVASAAAYAGVARAETHTVSFVNKRGFGTPTLLGLGGSVLSTGASYTASGPLVSAVACVSRPPIFLYNCSALASSSFLQTGNCGANGAGCTAVETTLLNPWSPETGSSTDISLSTPYSFSGTIGFSYSGAGCDGQGDDCTSPYCEAASRPPGFIGAVCLGDDVDLTITFCD